jgi:hypothetical protein
MLNTDTGTLFPSPHLPPFTACRIEGDVIQNQILQQSNKRIIVFMREPIHQQYCAAYTVEQVWLGRGILITRWVLAALRAHALHSPLSF